MNDFIGGFLVCSLIVSPFLTYFILKEIAWRRNLKAIEKATQQKLIPEPKPVEPETFEVLAKAEKILKIPELRDENVS